MAPPEIFCTDQGAQFISEAFLEGISGCPMSGAALTPLIRHLRNPAGVIQANLRDQASGFSG